MAAADDDVVVLSEERPSKRPAAETVPCDICGENVQFVAWSAHAERHKASSRPAAKHVGAFEAANPRFPRLDETLRTAFLEAGSKWETRLCSAFDWFPSEDADRGWGCGYHNTQTLLSALLRRDDLARSLFDGKRRVPSVGQLQRAIDEAHLEGFDREGLEQLGLLAGTRTWIGAVDAAAMLRWQGVHAEVHDFHLLPGASRHSELLDFAWRHFGAADGPDRFRPPLLFQHRGHSRAVVGAVRRGERTALVVLDGEDGARAVEDLRRGRLERVLIGADRLRANEYQLLVVERADAVSSPSARNELKVIRGVKHHSKP